MRLSTRSLFVSARRFFAVVGLASLSFFLSGCLATYAVKSGHEQLKLLRSRRPIAEVLNDPAVAAETKRKLSLSLEVREYVIHDLGFKETENYKTYVALDRPFVTWVAVASPKNRVEAFKWKFPIVGELPYKGYFSRAEAEAEAKKMDPQVYDIYVRGVSAYSTLGWFNDPILSTMIRGDDFDLVNLVIHESAHATLFIKGEADFNERLATFLGNHGTLEFYLKKEGPDSKTVSKIKAEDEDDRLFSRFVSEEIRNLNEWYKTNSTNLPEQQRLDRINEIKKRFVKEIKPKLKTERYLRFEKIDLNNAYLASLQTYVYDLSDFQNLLKKLKGDVRGFLNFCKRLEAEKDPSQKLKDFLRASQP